MEPTETARNKSALNATEQNRRPHNSSGRYQKVLDGRKHPIRGLWLRNRRFYARITVENEEGHKEVRRVALKASTVAKAQSELRRLLTQREESNLPVLKRTPKFADYAREYFAYYEKVKDAKRATTLEKERATIRLWIEHLGQTRLDKINRRQINSFIADRQARGLSGRTVNLDVIAFRNVMKRAREDGWIRLLPTEGMRPLKWKARTRQLVSREQIEGICEAALTASKNGAQLADYVKLLAFSGGRRSEALRLRWVDVDFDAQQLTIGADGLTKNYEKRVVDFNTALEAHSRFETCPLRGRVGLS